jgi:hypothetical protein
MGGLLLRLSRPSNGSSSSGVPSEEELGKFLDSNWRTEIRGTDHPVESPLQDSAGPADFLWGCR